MVCLNRFVYFMVGLGSIDRLRPVLSFEVNPNGLYTRIIHPLYNAQTFANDLGLLRLPIAIAEVYPFVAPIRLQYLFQDSQTLLREVGRISGFGRINDQSLEPSVLLQYANVHVIELEQCAQIYGRDVANVNVLCTMGSYFHQGPCANDNGGPLVIEEPTGSTLVGIQSFIHNSGCNAALPAGYVRLAPHVLWISNQAGVLPRV